MGNGERVSAYEMILDDGLPIRLEGVVRSWRELLAMDSPWSAMGLDAVDGLMPRVLVELLDLARDPDQTTRRQRMTAASRAHGAFRRSQACPGDPIRAEFAKLIVAIHVELQEAGLPPSLAFDVTTCLQPELQLARLAASRGFDAGPATEIPPLS